ncbi:MAG: hypothetical protein O2821_03625 [Chloroflexi bacterium]|nr:hypothetical protein [Chloroflexota bacterium]MDA1228341.1 hypothetical protein [Chloroflexota bacterium]
MAGYLYMVQMDVPDELEDDFNRIYDTQHIPNILTVPGVNSCTRFKLESSGEEGVAAYLALYEVDSLDIPQSPAWVEQSDKGDWAPKIRPHTLNRSHSLFRKLD